MKKSGNNKNDASSSGYEDSGTDTTLDLNEESHQNSDTLQSFLADRGFKGLKLQKRINLPQIDSDEEEVHLLRITKSIDPKILENTKFSLNKISKVKTQSGIYYMKPLADTPEPKVFIHSNGLKKISPVSVLQLEKFVDIQNKNKDAMEENEIEPVPTGLKTRHTIFGADYKERINLQEEIQQKLREALQRFDKKKKDPKRKKKQTVDNEEYDDKCLLISQILEGKFKDNNNKKKREHSNNLNSENDQSNTVQDCPDNSVNLPCPTPSEKKKKKKKEHGGLGMSIEIKKEVISESEIIESSTNEKKKKKRKRDSEETFITPERVKKEFDLIPPAKKRKPSILSSTVINESTPDFEFNISKIDNELGTNEIKKKRKNSDNLCNFMDESIDIKPDVSDIVMDIEERAGKKKKKKRKNADSSVQYNSAEEFSIDLKPPVNALENVGKAKKKKKIAAE